MNLERYLRRVLKWWWLILLSAGLAAGASYLASSRQPRIYQTTTTLMVGQVTQKTNPTYQDFDMSTELARSYAQITRRQPVLQGVIDTLGLPIDWYALQGQVSAYPIEGTQLLAVTVSDTSPERAVAIANEVAHQLILQSPTSPENKARQERGAFVKSQLDDLQTRIKGAKTRIEKLRTELDAAFSARQINEIQNEITDLESLINTWQANYSDLLRFLEGSDQTNLLTIIEPAPLSTVPTSPNVMMNVILATIVGFMLATAAALVVEYLDDTIKSPEDVPASWGVTVLGSVNQMKGIDYQNKMVTTLDTFSPVVEAYRLIRTNIQFAVLDQPAKLIMVTSSNPGEGKTLTVANLGVMMARAELRTIIVDADLRRPVMHKLFQLPNSEGLTDLLRSSELEIEPRLKATDVENLWVITSGPLPPNPTEMLGSPRMAELLDRLANLVDVIVIDSSPILAVTDATALSSRVRRAVLVVEAGKSRRKVVQQAIERLKQTRTGILGIVLNRVSGDNSAYATYNHSWYNSAGRQDLKGSTRRRWWQRLPVLK